jgi:catechol 2,3-dioxygenase-like lactoylglutathione lyase family enzyme
VQPTFEGHFLVLFVKDIDRARDFYEHKVGFTFDKGDERSAGMINGPDFLLLLNHDGADEMLGSDGVNHGELRSARQVIVAPVENVDEAYAALRARGVEFVRPPEDRAWGMRAAYFKDPDENIWEIHHRIGND